MKDLFKQKPFWILFGANVLLSVFALLLSAFHARGYFDVMVAFIIIFAAISTFIALLKLYRYSAVLSLFILIGIILDLIFDYGFIFTAFAVGMIVGGIIELLHARKGAPKEDLKTKLKGALIPFGIHAVNVIIFYAVINWPGSPVPYLFGWYEDFLFIGLLITFLPAVFGAYRYAAVASSIHWIGFYLGHFLGGLTYNEETATGETGYLYPLFGIIIGLTFGAAFEAYSANKRKANSEN